jgi:AAA family ATP:ADP antiporter
MKQESFTGWRSYIWPVHNHELKKILPMLLISFFVFLDYNILRTMKDTLVVTAKSSGAEVIPFIKVWVMFPIAVLLTFIYTHLSNRYSQQRVFYLIFGGFLAFFTLFTLVLYPYREQLHPHAFADSLQLILPVGAKGLVAMIRNWTFTLFYAMSELWGNIIVIVLFWGFANEITKVSEAKRFYGLFGIGVNFSGIVAGQLSIYLSRGAYNPALPFGEDAWHQTLILLLSIVLLVGVAALLLYRWMWKSVLSDKRYYDPEESMVNNKEKPIKMGIRENFRYIFRSRYLTCIMLIALSYNIVINLVEVVWKHEMRALFPDPSDYNTYFAQITTIIGVIATTTAIFVSGNSIRKLGWTFTAMITPVLLLITSVLFFGAFFFKDAIPTWMLGSALIGSTPLALVVFLGSMQNCLSRAAKYTVYDATRELAYIPLGAECKIRGKSAIDGIGIRLGKSTGSVCHQTLLLTFSTITASAPYVAGILISVIVGWTFVTRSLGKQFVELTEGQNTTPESEPATA